MNIQQLATKITELERNIRNAQYDMKFRWNEDDTMVYEVCLGIEDYITLDVINKDFYTYKEMLTPDYHEYSRYHHKYGLRVKDYKLIQQGTERLVFETRTEYADAWTDYEDDNVYMKIYADVLESEESFEQRKVSLAQKIKVWENELVELKIKLKEML